MKLAHFNYSASPVPFVWVKTSLILDPHAITNLYIVVVMAWCVRSISLVVVCAGVLKPLIVGLGILSKLCVGCISQAGLG